MLGQNITRLMKENGYTQRQLAMRAGCSECAISRYVNGEREPSIRILKNLAIALGVTVDELISERYCKDCIRYEDCKEYVSPYETFPETDGCERFQSAADVVPKSEVAREIFEELLKRIADEDNLFETCASRLVSSDYANGRSEVMGTVLHFIGGGKGMSNNTCICCGRTIPEGRQVCPTCEHDLAAYGDRIGAKTKIIGKFVPRDGVQLTIYDVEEKI